ncbi:MAG: hypothetical protein HOI53_02265 [Francisellaceae bacterium]|nr:hypothetical protein [Francisellaceae bacterium]MBT6538380.1 hypothetical protein [Francisellaceae bacterium]
MGLKSELKKAKAKAKEAANRIDTHQSREEARDRLTRVNSITAPHQEHIETLRHNWDAIIQQKADLAIDGYDTQVFIINNALNILENILALRLAVDTKYGEISNRSAEGNDVCNGLLAEQRQSEVDFTIAVQSTNTEQLILDITSALQIVQPLVTEALETQKHLAEQEKRAATEEIEVQRRVAEARIAAETEQRIKEEVDRRVALELAAKVAELSEGKPAGSNTKPAHKL